MANFGDILSGLSIGANQSVRRNAGDSTFEAYTPGAIANGGTNASSFAVSNGVVYFNGTALVNDADFLFDASNNRLTVGSTKLQSPNSNSLFLGAPPAPTYSGAQNTFIGQRAGEANTTGSSNTFIGHLAGGAVTTSYSNTAVGDSSLAQITAGNYGNVAIGASALFALTGGDDNVCVGRSALASLVSNSRNVGIGARAGNSINSGYDNTCIGGDYAGGLISSGLYNVCIGSYAGDNITTGSNNVAIGALVDVPTATASNQTNINDTFYGISGLAYIGSGRSFGIGITASPAAKLHVLSTTTPQRRTAYDGSNYVDESVSSSGVVTEDIVGSAPEKVYNDPQTFETSAKRKCGTGTQYAKIGGKIADFLDDYVSTTTEADAYVKSIVANSLAANGDQIEAEFSGIFAANANLKYLKITFAGTTIWDSGDINQNGESWTIRVTIMRQNSTTVKFSVVTTFLAANLGTDPPRMVGSVGSLTFSNAYDLKLRASSDNAGDLTAKFGWVKWHPAA